MAGNIAVNSNNSSYCVFCLQEISSLQNKIQPHNPRKVFKACVSYLKPEIFPKYSKWDFLSHLERRNPFCSMCATSGEKLSALNDRLEELQREIKSFVKYFTKEIQLLRDKDDDNEDFEEEDESEGRFGKVSLRSHSRQSNSVAKAPKDDPRCENGIKVENEDLDWNQDDEDYTIPSTEDDYSEDEFYIPKKTEKKEKPGEEFQTQTGGVVKSKRKRISRIQWKEIPFSDEKLKQDWIRRGLQKGKHYVTEYFYCKVGGKKCPAMLMKRSYIGVHYYENGKAHHHYRNEHHGISHEIKLEVMKILDEDPNARPNFILDKLKFSKGIELQKAKLINLLMYEKRKILIKSGLYEKNKSSPAKDKSTPGQKKRGRPPGSRNIFIPLANNSIAEPSVPVQSKDNVNVDEAGEKIGKC